MGIKDDANSLDAALKRSTNSARGLSFAIAEGGNNIGHAVHAAAELAEALAKASKVAKLAEMATGIGIITAVIGTAIAATVLWGEKQKEIAQQIRETHYATKALNAEAQNNPRLAAEIRISAEKQKQLEAIEKEQRALLGLGKHLHDYSGAIAAINAQAQAQLDALYASISRTFTRERASEGLQADMARLGLIADPEKQELEQNRLARLQAIRLKRESLQDEKLSPEEIDSVVSQLGRQFDNAADVIRNNHIKPLGDALGRSFASSIADGIVQGIQSGSIEKGFRALTGGMLMGLGRMMVEIGTQSLLAANLLNSIVSALKSFAPAGAIGPSLALIALGGVLQGIGASYSGGGGNGGGGGYGGGSYGSSLPPIVNTGVITAASALGNRSVSPLAPQQNTFFVIGPDDPRAGRQIQQLLDNNARRG